MGCSSGVKGLAAGKRQAPAGRGGPGRGNTVVLGVEGAPTLVVSRSCGTWKPR